jgi:solute carrier family 35 protein
VREEKEGDDGDKMPSNNDEENVSGALKTAVILGYMAVSSLMLMANKLAVEFIPAPATVLFVQFATSAIFAKVMQLFGNEVDPLEWGKVKAFILVVITQIGTIFSGMKALQYCNVETFIVFRASMPVVLTVLDYLCLGRALPGLRSTLCLAGLIVGAGGYALTESGFEIKGYVWIAVWYVIFCVDFAYIKYVVENVKMTTYGRVYYQNFLGSFGFILMIAITQEYNVITPVMLTDWKSVGVVLLSCFLGMGMSTFSYKLRAMVSSTYMAIIGNMCKVITVLINFFLWDKHANAYGFGFLALCLVCAYYYEQAPRREDVGGSAASSGKPQAVPTEEVASEDDDGVEDDDSDVDSDVGP